MTDDIPGLTITSLTATVPSGQIAINGQPLTISTPGGITSSMTVLWFLNPVIFTSDAAVRLTWAGQNPLIEFVNTVSGSGSLTVSGPGQVEFLSSSPSLSGRVTVDGIGGVTPTILVTMQGDGLGSGSIKVRPRAYLEVGGSPFNNRLFLGGVLVCGLDDVLNGPITLTAPATLTNPFDTRSCTFNGRISGAFPLILQTTGTFLVTASNTFSGGTAINGVVQAGPNPNPLGTGPISIASGSLLTTGACSSNAVTVASGSQYTLDSAVGSITSNGTLVPVQDPGPHVAHPVGQLSIGGGSFAPRLDSASAYGALRASGLVKIVSGATLNPGLAFAPPPGTAFTLVRNVSGSPISGTFSGLPEGAAFTVGTTRFEVTYRGNHGNDLVIMVPLQS